jgi:hypothetical protein
MSRMLFSQGLIASNVCTQNLADVYRDSGAEVGADFAWVPRVSGHSFISEKRAADITDAALSFDPWLGQLSVA